MTTMPQRVFWGVLAVFPGVYLFLSVFYLVAGLMSGRKMFLSTASFIIVILFHMAVGTVAGILGWCAMKEDQKRVVAAMGSGIRGGFILGLIGFAGGFFGPILLAPDANQGPLLGIFFTGPLGVFIGFLLGFIGEIVYPEESQDASNRDEESSRKEPSDPDAA